MKGYKVFNPNWTCRDFQYEVGKTYKIEEKPICCERGFHFCKRLVDCFNYYIFNPDNKVAEVEALGEIDSREDKSCTNMIKIINEISWIEVLEKVNVGGGNTGCRNSGDYNNGDCNSGYWNSGDWNSGNCNSGNYNSGNYNNGYYNSGYYNSGHYNSGNCNSGNCNSGNCNSGDYNSGYWNTTNGSNGMFNTKIQNIILFNKPSSWTYDDLINSKALKIIQMIPQSKIKWICLKDMTDIEKEKHPEARITGGYLTEINVYTKDRQNWWNQLSEKEKLL